jgi:uncharacterized protein YbbC (DUF1343 family)
MFLLLFCSILEVAPAELTRQSPADLGFDERRLERVEELVNEGIREKKMPGCVICFGRKGKIAYLRPFGNKQLEPSEVAMTVDTLFDMASITKPVATGTSIMKLVEQGKLRLAAKVVDYFPEFAPNGKDRITVHDLLIHQSGLIPDNPLKDYLDGPEIAWERICQLDLVAPVGTSFKYSDVNFIVLAKLVEKVSGRDIHRFSREEVFQPLGMRETGYLPSDELRKRAATTEQREGRWMIGEVHDPRAYELNGIAGHAGLFSTATDLARYATMMLGKGSLEAGDKSVRILSPTTVNVMTRAYAVSSGERALSWDKRTSYSINRGDLLTDSAFGHGGFTGNVFWIDPELDLFFIFLSNRVHPQGKGLVNPLAGQILNQIVASMVPVRRESDSRPPMPAEVLTGLDVLVRNGYRQIAGERIGLVTNHTGRDRQGNGIVRLFHNEPQVKLQALFSPEHGFEGRLDIAKVADAEDQQTGLKIFSLYGETRQPTAEMCKEIDTFVFDIQDIGTRFYTYISTMGEVMRAASEHRKRLVILDRPNPIGGVAVSGPMLDPGKESFVGFHLLPVRHGMTIGELARLFQAELKLDLKLDVIPCEGWSRDQLFDHTGLAWINPSPNMRSLTQALLYPGIGLLETTNLSVGRGTDTPFEVIGAPWINGRELARALRELDLSGTAFVPIEFTPTSSKFENQLCQGVNILITDRRQWEPVRVGLAVACTLRRLYPQEWEVKNFVRLLGNDACYESVVHGQSLEEVMLKAVSGVADFKRRRSTFFLYR